MRIIFAGTPDFARIALQHLLDAGFTVALVLTQPDRPAGRGMKVQASSVKQCAQKYAIPVIQPRSLRLDGKYPADARAAHDALLAADANVMIVAAYGLILPQWVLDLMGGSAPSQANAAIPKWGCLNIHASLLPRWRGAAPIHRAIEGGDTETGVTIMQMDAGLDTGAMLLAEHMPIESIDTTASLHDRLADMGGRLIVQALHQASNNGLRPVAQPAVGVTYAHKIEKSESAIDWSKPAREIGQRIRALDPFPGASTACGHEVIKLWRCEIDSNSCPIGKRFGEILSIDEAGITVACGDGTLRITSLQRAGGKRLPAADFLRGFAMEPSMVLGWVDTASDPAA